MYLLTPHNDSSFRLVKFVGSNIPPYAILSHTWGPEEDEVDFQDLINGTGHDKPGYSKILFCAREAEADNLHYFWVDTCCIDKKSSAELSEAINSMYLWYEQAVTCYAFLSDLERPRLGWQAETALPDALRQCRWFTRGWTLQELLASKNLRFYDCHGLKIGTKRDLANMIEDITGVGRAILLKIRKMQECSVAKKMSWLARRETTRVEDMAYCMLGIFGVNMPLLYGEGAKAFFRLQEEIIRVCNDHTIFCWTWNSSLSWRSVLAPSPSAFRYSRSFVRSEPHNLNFLDLISDYRMTNAGLKISLPVVRAWNTTFALLNAQDSRTYRGEDACAAVPLLQGARTRWWRCDHPAHIIHLPRSWAEPAREMLIGDTANWFGDFGFGSPIISDIVSHEEAIDPFLPDIAQSTHIAYSVLPLFVGEKEKVRVLSREPDKNGRSLRPALGNDILPLLSTMDDRFTAASSLVFRLANENSLLLAFAMYKELVYETENKDRLCCGLSETDISVDTDSSIQFPHEVPCRSLSDSVESPDGCAAVVLDIAYQYSMIIDGVWHIVRPVGIILGGQNRDATTAVSAGEVD